MKLSQITEARYASKEPQYKCGKCDARFTEREMIKKPREFHSCPNCASRVIIPIREARYVGANRPFLLTWDTHFTHMYDFGITSAKPGVYASESGEDFVFVVNNRNEALAKAQQFFADWDELHHEGERLDWVKGDFNRYGKSFGSSLDRVRGELEEDWWSFYGDTGSSYLEIVDGKLS